MNHHRLHKNKWTLLSQGQTNFIIRILFSSISGSHCGVAALTCAQPSSAIVHEQIYLYSYSDTIKDGDHFEFSYDDKFFEIYSNIL